MASSKKLAPSELDAYLQARLPALIAPGRRATLALSGGVDSVVLLNLLLSAQRTLNFSLSALHVNHHLSPHAKEWAAFCAALCAEHGVPLIVKNVQVPRRSPLGLEAAARSLRYQAFAELDSDVLLLAHHLDDQAETLLLNLLRGAGVRGAAGMPASRRHTLLLARPLIDVPRASLMAYAKQHRLAWVEDESNDNIAFARNFLRHDVLPVIERRFPAYRQTLTRAAQHFSEADALLDELAAIDLASAVRAEKLHLAALASLSHARAKNLFRAYLESQGVPLLDADRLQEWLRQLLTARADSRVALGVAGLMLRRYRGEAWVEFETPTPAPDWQMAWRGEREINLPVLGGKLLFTSAQGAGISLAKLMQFDVTLRLRQGGEKLKPSCARPRKTLKHLLQEAAIPPWQRERLPLIYSGAHLVAVPDIGIDCAFHAAPSEPGLKISWASH
jgi:tRNA(Ile)-lysidine synthase